MNSTITITIIIQVGWVDDDRVGIDGMTTNLPDAVGMLGINRTEYI